MRVLNEEVTIMNNVKGDKMNELRKSLMVVLRFLAPEELGCVHSDRKEPSILAGLRSSYQKILQLNKY